MPNNIRAFIAIPLPQVVLDQLGYLREQLRRHGLPIRWVRVAGIHLTLKFLGDIPAARVAEVAGAVEAAVVPCQQLELLMSDMGVFPNIQRAKVIWAGIEGNLEGLADLQQKVETALEPLGFVREKRRFTAHLTLGRSKARIAAKALSHALTDHGGYDPVPFQAREVVLYQSQLRPNGVLYTRLANMGLGRRAITPETPI
jgi:2'-5' RNA ligase